MLDGTSVTPPPLNWIVLPVTVMGFTTLLKTTRRPALVPIFFARLGGARDWTVSAALSLVEPVVKLKPGEGAASPLALVTPVLVNHTWYPVPATKDPPGGVMRMTWPVLSNPMLSGVTYPTLS